MKNLPKRVRQKSKGSLSSYARKNKRPHKHSAEYHTWRKNRLTGKSPEQEISDA